MSDKNDWIIFFIFLVLQQPKSWQQGVGRAGIPRTFSLVTDAVFIVYPTHMSSLRVYVPVPSFQKNTNPSTQLDDLILS